MTVTKTRKAAFVVTGEFVADHGRDRVFEFGWEDGLRFLSAALPDMTYEQMVTVLDGTKTLTGDSETGLELADETPERRKEVLFRYGWLYAGTFYHRPSKKYWRPYAVVTSWGPGDMRPPRIPNRYIPFPSGSMLRESMGDALSQWAKFRCVRYMDDAIEDNMWHVAIPGGKRVTGDGSVLFRQAPSPPPFWKHLTDPQAAVVEFIAAGHRLEVRGASQEYREEEEVKRIMGEIRIPKDKAPPATAAPTMPPGPPVPDGAPDNFLAELMRERGVPDEIASGIARALTDTGEYPLPEPTKDPAKAKWAWVDRQGRFWPCRGYMDHIPLADPLCRHHQLETGPYAGNASRTLESAGWAKVGFSNLGRPYASYVSRAKKTKAQIDAIAGWFMCHAKDEPDYADRLRAWVEDGDGFDY